VVLAVKAVARDEPPSSDLSQKEAIMTIIDKHRFAASDQQASF
jgi:hypothetical protein